MRLRTLALACVAAWVGIAAFFSFVVAPLVFRVVDRTVAGRAVGAVLPSYYAWGVVLALVAFAAYAVLTVRGPGRVVSALGAILCAAMVATLVWAWLVVLPRAESARSTRADTAFARAHRMAVGLNGLTLAAGAAVVLLEAVRRAPRSSR
jgi:hypothetical protein